MCFVGRWPKSVANSKKSIFCAINKTFFKLKICIFEVNFFKKWTQLLDNSCPSGLFYVNTLQ